MATTLRRLVGAPPPQATDWIAAVAAFLTRCAGKNLAPGTLRFYRDKLTAVQRGLQRAGLDALPVTELRPPHLREFLAAERRRTSPQQARHCYVTLRVFFGFLVADGWLDVSPLGPVEPPKQPKTRLPSLTLEQVTALVATCGGDFYGVRDRAILLLLLDTGLRAAELLSLTREQVATVAASTGAVVTRAGGTLSVVGKGAIPRDVFFGPTTATAVREYLRRREGIDTPALFLNQYAAPLTYSGLAQLLRRRGTAAGLPPHAAHPHAFRHTFATLFLRHGGNVFVLQRLLGHATLTMTERYVAVTGDDLATAHARHAPAELLPAAAPPRKRLR